MAGMGAHRPVLNEARRAFVVEIDAIMSELLVMCHGPERHEHAERIRTLRRYVLDKFDQGATDPQLLADHSVALEFVRELASTPCAWGCIADHPDEQPCIHCRAAKWLHSEDEPDPIASVPPGDEAFAPPFRRTKP